MSRRKDITWDSKHAKLVHQINTRRERERSMVNLTANAVCLINAKLQVTNSQQRSIACISAKCEHKDTV